jgi:hypothetical protein
MQTPFGSILNLTVFPARSWLSLGPGWAMLAGSLSTGAVEIRLATLLQVLTLWLLVDPLLGALWELSAQQGIWRRMMPAQLPPPTPRGFYLPYALPGSVAGHWVLQVRRYAAWWRGQFWPDAGQRLVAFGLVSGLALLISLSFNATLGWLTLLALSLIILAGQTQPDLAAPDGGRLQSIVQLLLPWVMGVVVWSNLGPLNLALGICYWVTYLGGLRIAGQHKRAEILFFLGQIAAVLLLLALRWLPGAAMVGALLVGQLVIKTKFSQPADFLAKAQPYLILSLLVAGWSLGQAAG